MTETQPQTWVDGAAGSLYDVDNLPYAVVTTGDEPAQVGVRIGEQVLDLGAAARALRPAWTPLLGVDRLNPLLAAGAATWAEVRAWVVDLLTDPGRRDQVRLLPLADVACRLPFEVADYVDYYASEHHATNVGRIFRPDGAALLPNWKHLPVGYHGRAGSIVVSGTPVHRPAGQRKAPTEDLPSYGPSRRLDIEAELGFVVGRSVPLGTRVATAEFADTVFGVAGVNDWSARDIQAWEYVPLGPHLAKSFATSISAWVTPLAALEPARVPLPGQDVPVLQYLREEGPSGYDIEVEVELNGTVVARPPYRSMYWSPAQMLAHLTVNGASLRVGDLYASGTISGPDKDQRGSFLELSWGGREPFVAGGAERTFLEDGDEVVLRYTAPGARGRIGLGEVRGRILPTS
ncbi:fumarylacetoacetase [Nocardioides sp. LHD-245]|uniref:fumarylacetoacetase n=1 Tax=Nocardioides sp. LHD-245 TaxID=3051387 RepID=UPI0027E0B6BF|nr:fumarylacetoacetase [Nocardioides sp. LHD-245]